MVTTNIWVYNSIQQPNSNVVLMFLQPIAPLDNYAFSAWNTVNPSPNSHQKQTLTTTFAGSIAAYGSSDYSDPAALQLGQPLKILNDNGQGPRISDEPSPVSITPDEIGLYNDATTPPTDLSVTWYVSGNKVVETNNSRATSLNPGFTSTFQLKQSVFLMFGQMPTVTSTYVLQTLSAATEIPIPNGATDVHVEAYTDSDGFATFKPVPRSQWLALTGTRR